MNMRLVATVVWGNTAIWSFSLYSQQPESCPNFAQYVRSRGADRHSDFVLCMILRFDG
jgi:hypothetical protein